MECGCDPARRPMVSVLVPVYNVEKYLAQCLDSILTQTYRDFELILCDDGSTDQSGEICDRYAQQHPTVRVIHKENEGLLRTRRRLFREAKGTFVLCVDSDDWIAQNLLEQTVHAAEETQSDMVLFGYKKVQDDGTTLEQCANRYPDRTTFSGESRKALCRDFATSVELNHIWDKLIRRELIGTEEESDPLYQRHLNGEDKLQLLPVFHRAQRLCYLAQPLYCYRISATGMGRNYQLQYFSDLQQVNQRVLRFLQQEHLDDAATSRAFYSRYCRSLTVLISDVVLSGRFRQEDIHAACREVYQSDLYQQAKRHAVQVNGSAWIRLLHWLFRNQKFEWMQRLLRCKKRWNDR